MLQIPRSVLAPACAVLVLVLAGCGSQLDPQTVAQVSGSGVGPDGQVAGDGGTGTASTARSRDRPAAAVRGATRAPVGPAPRRPVAPAEAATPPRAAGTTPRPAAPRRATAPASRTRPASPTTRSRSATPPTSAARCPGCSRAAQEASQGVRRLLQLPAATSAAASSSSTPTTAAPTRPPTSRPTPRAATRPSRWSARCRPSTPAARRPPSPAASRTSARSATTAERLNCTTCFAARGGRTRRSSRTPCPTSCMKNYGDAGQHAAMLYINAGAAAENGKTQAAAMEKRGMHFDYVQGIDISEFNYAPYVQQMKDKGIEYVQMIASTAQFTRLADAMKQQGFEPEGLHDRPDGVQPRLRQQRRRRRRRHHRLRQLHAVRGGQLQQGAAALPAAGSSR